MVNIQPPEPHQALSLWSGSTDSKTLDYQRTNPREYQIVRTHQRKPLEYKAGHNPTTSSTLSRTPHLSNKQNKNTNPLISRQDYPLTQPCPSKEKQRNKQKLNTNLTLYKAYHFVTTGPTLGWQKPKGRNNSTFKLGKGRPQTHTKYNAKAEKY